MNTFNKASTHKDLKRDFEMDDAQYIEEGIQELLDNKEDKEGEKDETS